jgi:hypothetical protein
MSAVFICYRREDSGGHAGRLYDHLVSALGRDCVFMDVGGSMLPGTDFVEEIEKRVKMCDVLLAVIGPKWLAPTPESARSRLFRPNDYVRMELCHALQHGRRVIPVLLNGSVMPSEQQLPEEITAFSRRHAFKLDDDGFEEDVVRLIAAINVADGKVGVGSAQPERGDAPASPGLDKGLSGIRPIRWALALAGALVLSALAWGTTRALLHPAAAISGAGVPAAAPSLPELMARSTVIVQRYRDDLLTRFESSGWISAEVKIARRDPWAQSQALAALLSVPSSLSLLDSVLKRPLEVLLKDRSPEGWNNGDFHPYFHVDPVLWTGLALNRLRALPSGLYSPAFQKQFWEMAGKYREGYAWHEFPLRFPSQPSLYATALGLVLLTEVWVDSGRPDSDLKRQIGDTANWLALQARYRGQELQGWTPEVGSPAISIGVSLLAAYAIMRAHRETHSESRMSLAVDVPNLLRRLVGAGPVGFEQNDSCYFIGGEPPNQITHQVRITWSPWAMACASEWMRDFGTSASVVDATVVRKAWGDLLSLAESQNVQTTYTFLLAEHLLVLARAVQSI